MQTDPAKITDKIAKYTGVQFDSFTIKAGNNAGVAETFELEHLMMAPTSGTVTPTVEPATLVLVGTGLAGLRFVRRKLPFQS